ncbi:MAG: 23S rRNA (guanosine(2251)-2'-O)-methyltransferase RlmB [Thermoanaerobaculia bacterium]|nr:23S rRNA (guanosine(2251)-2'-O)-methyltransferase RlmB [Thermoanaerobaculia bacterium]
MKLYGFHPVREILRSRPHEVERVACAASAAGRRRQIEDLCRRHGVAFRTVARRDLDDLATGEASTDPPVHNGFVAWVRTASSGETAATDMDLVVLLEDVQDPRNLGAILRVCEGAGVGTVLVRDRGSAKVGEVAVKTSAGATEYLSVERVVNTARTLEELKQEGFWVYGADAGGDAPWTADLTGKVVLCLGGEADGLRRLTRERCDLLLGLPMRGKVASLNVATAAAALLYEAVRQRLTD